MNEERSCRGEGEREEDGWRDRNIRRRERGEKKRWRGREDIKILKGKLREVAEYVKEERMRRR